MIPVTTYFWTEPLTEADKMSRKARAEWSGYKYCQASSGDGECIAKRCPNADLKCPGGCPLPWRREEDDSD